VSAASLEFPTGGQLAGSYLALARRS
jgi:hypothetical protein